MEQYLKIVQSLGLSGTAFLYGAKNSVLVVMASTLLTNGISILKNVPASSDVFNMISLLEGLGAQISFDQEKHELRIDTSSVSGWQVDPAIMKKMRASVLVMGPLLARFQKVVVARPGGCLIGARPLDCHLSNFEKMGAQIAIAGSELKAEAKRLVPGELVLDYPSVGATENLLMAAVGIAGTTTIINAALEPEVLDLISVLRKMGASIETFAPATIVIHGGMQLKPIEHEIIPDRLEAGALLLAAAITGGAVSIPQARADHMHVFLQKLEQMGHSIIVGPNKKGISIKATKSPRAVSFKTGPYPNFPTDLQAPMMALQCVADGKSEIEETVFENRMHHVRELQKMGAVIEVVGSTARITGVDELFGTHVIANEIRGACALALAGLVAQGSTTMTGVAQWLRCYDHLEIKLAQLGADISLQPGDAKFNSEATNSKTNERNLVL